MRTFEEKLVEAGQWPLRASGIETLQVNLGKLSNRTCRHCPVDAGPTRRDHDPRHSGAGHRRPVVVVLLAFANGSNDVSKSVATLAGGGPVGVPTQDCTRATWETTKENFVYKV